MSEQVFVSAIYQFEALAEPRMLREALLKLGVDHSLRGTVILSKEGVNGTLAGREAALKTCFSVFNRYVNIAEPILHPVRQWPFRRLFVHVKREIVTMGLPDINPNQERGVYVEPLEWNRLVDDPEILLVDTRNDFEVRLGSFEGAQNPETVAFADFPKWADAHADQLRAVKGVAMFCTGGIRCEKATSYLKRLGIEQRFHLRGGILNYLRQVEPSESRFHGDCFVFDDRIALSAGLEVNETVAMCFGCRHPVTKELQADPRYEIGVSCPDCYDTTTDAQKQKYRSRHAQRQRLRALRGES